MRHVESQTPCCSSLESLKWVSSRVEALLSSLPIEAKLADGWVRLRLGGLLPFEFEGVLEVAHAENTATYIIKGPRGLLIVASTLVGGLLRTRVSSDAAGRLMGRKLLRIAESFGKTLAVFSESYEAVSKFEGSRLPVSDGLIPHIARFYRFSLGKPSFTLCGRGDGELRIVVEGEVLKRVEHESPSGSAIVEVGKPLRDVTEDDLDGLGISGEYVIGVLG